MPLRAESVGLVVAAGTVIVSSLLGGWFLGQAAGADRTPLRGESEVAARATIVAVETETSGVCIPLEQECSDSTRYEPVVRFTTSSGETIEARSRCFYNDKPASGDRVTVHYETENPIAVCVADGIEPWNTWVYVGTILALPFAAAFVFYGLLGGRWREWKTAGRSAFLAAAGLCLTFVAGVVL
jgi:hypothetical protein